MHSIDNAKHPLRIALIYPESASDVRTWSGTPFFVKQTFERYVGEVIDLSPYTGPTFIYKAATHLGRKIGRNIPYGHNLSYSRALGRYFSRTLEEGEYDLVLSPGGGEGVAFLQTDLPVVLYSDATWDLMVDYYSAYSGLPGFVRKAGEEIESRAIRNSTLLLYSSHWAAESAKGHYGKESDQVLVPYLGANLLEVPSSDELKSRRRGDRLRLLLVGVNWEIKGGAVALQVLQELLDRGYDAELTVAGCRVPDDVSHPRLTVVPFLNKQIPAEREKFEALWRNADFFILPSRFEAAGLVFCEASAHGLPIVAARTGGIPSIVVEGKNGYTVPHEEEPLGYVEIIERLWNDSDAYDALADSTRREFDERLNWGVVGEKIGDKLGALIPDFRERILAYRAESEESSRP